MKKKSISNQIKTKYKNIQLNSYLTLSQTTMATTNKRHSSTSGEEKLKLLNNDLKFPLNGFSNNKKLKTTTNSNNNKKRFSLRSSFKKPKSSIKRSNSEQEEDFNQQNRITRLSLENETF